ncbi:serine/threonine protein kinase [Hallella absiana]|uniref:serine/threonine protein kinase n=1 Tax=Hallella absiana TaxID=2925336 RepID=UPI0021C94440|nr:serine/threonine-protein kinase [Hallella absiana]
MTEDTSFSDFIEGSFTAPSSDYTGFEKIADGAICTLWRANKDGQRYVVKSLQAEYRDQTQYIARLRKEYDILSIFDSPYVVKAVDYCRIPLYGMCLVMEWIDGVTLKQWLYGPCSPDFPRLPNMVERRRAALEIVRAVEYIHSLQVVHRDLKPSNIMVTRTGRQVKLIDFGLADTDSFTIFKEPGGTKGYIAPEQRKISVTDERNDVYSLGIILQEMRLGRMWRGIIHKMLKPIDQRLGHVSDVIVLLHRRTRFVSVLTGLCLAVALFGGGFWTWDRIVNPRPHFEVVTRFQYSNMIFESWGGGKVTIRPAINTEEVVEIPSKMSYDGFSYQVDEITFNAFKNDSNLHSIIIPGGVHLMKGAFKHCPNLRDIYIRGNRPPRIGNEYWPADINDVFDASHFSSVRIHIPKHSRAAYSDYPWTLFKHYVLY